MNQIATPQDYDAQLAAWMQDEEEKSKTSGNFEKFDEATYLGRSVRLRVLPDGDPSNIAWFTCFGKHFYKKGLIGNERPFTFVSSKLTYGDDNDPIWIAVQKARNSGDPVLEAIADEVKAGPQYLANMMLVPDGQQVADVQTFRINKTMRDEFFRVARMVSNRFQTLEANIIIHVKFSRFDSGRGLKATVESVEQPTDLTALGYTNAHLPVLQTVVEAELANSKPSSAFSGDLLHPIVGTTPGAAAIPAANMTPAPALAAPATPDPALAAPVMPAPQTVLAQAPAPVMTPAPVAAPVAQSAPTPVEVPAPAPTATVVDVTPSPQSGDMTATPAAAPSQAAAPVPAPAPTALPQSPDEAAALEQKLLAMVGEPAQAAS